MISFKPKGGSAAKKMSLRNNSAFAWRILYNNRLGIVSVSLITISLVNLVMRGNPPSPTWRKFYLENMHTKHFNCTAKNEQVGSFRASIGSLKEALHHSPRSKCSCKFAQNTLDPNKTYLASHCSEEATAAGGGQEIVSFSLFAKPNMTDREKDYFERRYFRGIKTNLDAIKIHYPGWLMRIYSNLSLDEDLCKIVCLDKRIYFCDVNRNEKLKNVHPMTWRYLPLGDATVSTFISRDLDSKPNEREANAVREWMNSGYPFHAMRDHKYHLTTMLGGMWGASNAKLCWNNGKYILNQIMNVIPRTEDQLDDQSILTKTIYWTFFGAVLVHDSYLCNIYRDSLPFPSKRANKYEWIGKIMMGEDNRERAPSSPLTITCPPACRPPHGLDWEYC